MAGTEVVAETFFYRQMKMLLIYGLITLKDIGKQKMVNRAGGVIRMGKEANPACSNFP